MRPLRLEVQGFTCYRDEQPALDLSAMSLFAIAGPTGAGKSTILDAILYALYGTLPRLVGRDAKLSEFVSHGSNVLSVCLDFRMRGDTYRLVRKAKVSSKGQVTTSATFAQVVSGAEKSLASGVTDVDAAVKQRLGLDFSAFTQTVILPQNQFAAFLQAKPKARRTMLQQLLGHEIYPKMRELAHARRAGQESRLRSIDDQLQQLVDATPEALGALDARLADARSAEATARAAYAALSARVQDLRARRALTLDLEQWSATLQELEAEAPAIDRLVEELSLARRAAAIVPLIRAVDEARGKAEKAQCDLEVATDSARSTKAAVDAAERMLQEATAAAVSLDRWRAELRRFDQISTDVERLPAFARELHDAQQAVGPAERGARDAQAEVERLQAEVEAARARVEQAIASRDAVHHDAALQTELEARMADVASAKASAQRVAQLQSEVARLVRDLEMQEQSVMAARMWHAAALSASDAARDARVRAEQARHDGIRRHAAMTLRHDLEPGAACPVCEQIVSAVPSQHIVPEMKVLADQCVTAQQVEAEAAHTMQAASSGLAEAEAAVSALRSQIERERTECDAKRSDLLALSSGIAAVVAAPGPPDLPLLLDAFDAAMNRVKAAGLERQRLEQLVTQAERARGEAELAQATADGTSRHAEQHLSQAHADVNRCTKALDEARQRIAAVTSADDPVAARDELAGRVEQISGAVSRATETAQETREAWRVFEARVESLTPVARAASTALEDADRSLAEALVEHGFTSVDQVKEAARTPGQEKALAEQVSTFREQQATARARVQERAAQVGSEPVSAAMAEAAEAELATARNAADAAARETSRLDTEQGHLATRVDRALALAADRTSVQACYHVAHEMEADLRSDGFQHFLLTETFRTLVAGASTRLREMSRRYSMEWRDDDFFVLDHDNAGERRRAETLSGGETFMASLCLALQLSDEILHASGAVRMDSLFIDEGFGSLDPVSLGDVADALDNLRADGDRLVGIISHVPELTDRLPGCIRIEKGVGESKWVVERVG